MSLTNEDLQKIKGIVQETVKREVQASEKRLSSTIVTKFKEQNEFFTNALANTAEIIKQAIPSREEFIEIKNRVEELEDELEKIRTLVIKLQA